MPMQSIRCCRTGFGFATCRSSEFKGIMKAKTLERHRRVSYACELFVMCFTLTAEIHSPRRLILLATRRRRAHKETRTVTEKQAASSSCLIMF